MRCPKCGVEVRDEARFCDECGISLEEYGVLDDSRPTGEPEPSSPTAAAAARERAMIAFVAFDLMLAAGMILFFLRMA
jgi:predicted amidophosphoribosyltransferase